MKKTTFTILTGLAFAATAQAGEHYSTDAGVMPAIAAPVAASGGGLWSWFAGGSVGQIGGDWDEEIYTLHLGVERASGNGTQAIYLEVGYTEAEESFTVEEEFTSPNPLVDDSYYLYTDYKLEGEVIPITINYKYESALTGNLNWYVGAGIGIALVDLSISSAGSSVSDDDTALYGHIFAGLVYNFSEAFEVFAGARYVYMDDVTLFGIEDDAGIDGEIHYELGARFNF